jgi:DNA adenine methylase
VNRKLPHLGDGGKEAAKLARVLDWFQLLRDSFREARVSCGSWERICSVGSVTRNGIAGVLLDPPYSQTEAVYAQDSSTVAHDVRKWCVEHGQNPKLRIALCGHDTEHNELERLGWSVETWDKSGGYQGKDDRERIWFSPACLKAEQQAELFAA